VTVSPSKKSVQQLKTKVRKLLVPGNNDPWPEVRDDLNRSLRGWSSYFNLGSPVAAFRSVDQYVRERVRAFLARRHKVAGRGTRRFTVDEIHQNRGVLCLERPASTCPAVGLAVKPVGEPDAVAPQVRFDERCALQVCTTQPPEMAAAAKPSEQSRTESCVASGNGRCEA